VREGRVAELLLQGRTPRRLTWTKLGAAMVVTRLQTGVEDLNSRCAGVDGALLSVEFDFKVVFGAEWGPEHIRLGDAALK
jgi:hypothetical protein